MDIKKELKKRRKSYGELYDIRTLDDAPMKPYYVELEQIIEQMYNAYKECSTNCLYNEQLMERIENIIKENK